MSASKPALNLPINAWLDIAFFGMLLFRIVLDAGLTLNDSVFEGDMVGLRLPGGALEFFSVSFGVEAMVLPRTTAVVFGSFKLSLMLPSSNVLMRLPALKVLLRPMAWLRSLRKLDRALILSFLSS